MSRSARYESMQHAVYETERAMWLIFREERRPWEVLTPGQRQEYGMRLLGLTVVDRRNDAREM